MDKIIISLATFPARKECLNKVIQSIYNQCDAINVYLNEYKDKPKFLEDKKINAIFGENLGDAGKFFTVDREKGYYFTIDDDILYPKDYTRKMIEALVKFQNKAIVGVHGYVLNFPNVRNIYKDRNLTHYRNHLTAFRNVHVAGTGTVAFHTDAIKLSLADFPRPNMADVWLSLAAQKQKVPIYLVPRCPAWLKDVPEALRMESIYSKSKGRSHGEFQTQTINQYKSWRLYSA